MLATVLLPALLGELIEPFQMAMPVHVYSSSSAPEQQMMHSMLSRLQSQVAQMRSTKAPTAAPPTHPCKEDIVRLKCTDTACLKRAAEDLAPACAAYLLGAPQPSPEPAPARRPQPTGFLTMSRPMQPMGYFSLSTTGSDGEVHRFGGDISRLIGSPMMVPRSAILSQRPAAPTPAGRPSAMTVPAGLHELLGSVFPPELVRALTTGLDAAELAIVDDDADEPRHPCAQEVALCTRETHSSGREAIQACLIRHVEQLSAECKCFVHHIAGDQLQTAARQSAAAPTVRVVAAEPRVAITVAPVAESVSPRVHSLSCLFIFTFIFLVTFMLVRTCIVLCCCTPVKRHVVVVPPEHTTIKTLNPPPMLVAEMGPAVQVAEPYRK